MNTQTFSTTRPVPALIFVLTLFSIVTQVWAATPEDYFVDFETGNDDWSGELEVPNNVLTDGPWKTADKVFEYSLKTAQNPGFNPGDTISFRSGQEFIARTGDGTTKDNEGNFLPVFGSSGEADQPIVIGAYGLGAKPILRVRVSEVDDSQWGEEVSAGVWAKKGTSYSTGWTYRTESLWENDMPMKHASSFDCLKGIGTGCPDGNWYHDFKAAGTPSWAKLYYRPTLGTLGEKVYYGRPGQYVFNGLHHITIKDISFRTNKRPVRFWATNNPINDIVVENCEFYATEYGVDFRTSSYDIVDIKFNNNSSDYVLRPISLETQGTIHSFYNAEIAYNSIKNCNGNDHWDGDQQTIYIQHVNTSQIHHNIISGGQCAGISGWYDGSAGRTFQGNTISHNLISNTQGTGAYEAKKVAYAIGIGGGPALDVCYNNDISNNTITHADQGILVANCHVNLQQKNRVRNNTLIANGINILVRAGAKNWIFEHNIISSPEATLFEPLPAHIVHESNYAQGSGVELNYNLYYPDGATLFGNNTCRNATTINSCPPDERDPLTFTNFENWKAATIQDQQSVTSP